MADLLLHSMSEFHEIIFELLDRTQPKTIMEIGSETGIVSDRLVSYCQEHNARLITIEPIPAEHLIERATNSEAFDLVIGQSIVHLREHGCDADLVLIDGDHNYYTVFNELSLIQESWAKAGRHGIILMHDVGFPWARRDLYYDPSSIPESERHPYSYELGVTLDCTEAIRGGFRGEGQFACALTEGGPKNGVLTAIEDFLAANEQYSFRHIDAVFGLGVLYRRGGDFAPAVESVFNRYDTALLRRMERNRLELYLRVIELQDQFALMQQRNS